MADNSKVTNISGSVYLLTFPYRYTIGVSASIVLPGSVAEVVANLGGATAISGVLTVVAASANAKPNLAYIVTNGLVPVESWSAGASTQTGHVFAPRTLLADGRVFVAIGSTSGFEKAQTAKAGIYSPPPMNSWENIPDFPGDSRSGFGCIQLTAGPYAGDVMIFGGIKQNGQAPKYTLFKDSWRYSLTARTWTRGPDLPLYVFGMQTIVLDDGRIFIQATLAETSGTATGAIPVTQKTFIYHQTTTAFGIVNTFDYTRDESNAQTLMLNKHGQCAIEKLNNGNIVIVGGRTAVPDYTVGEITNKIDIFHPTTGTYTEVTMPTCTSDADDTVVPGCRSDMTVTKRGDGTVLIAGGNYFKTALPFPFPRISTLLLNAAGTEFITTRGPSANSNSVDMTMARSHHMAARLFDGRVLLASGFDANFFTSVKCETHTIDDTFLVVADLPAKHVKAGVLEPNFYAFEQEQLRCTLTLLTGDVFMYPGIHVEGNSGAAIKDTLVFSVGTPSVSLPPVIAFSQPSYNANTGELIALITAEL